MNPILPLSTEAVSQIHSSRHITSLQGVVLSLLENALDAGSTKVNITIDFRRACCTVEDNGLGIADSEFGPDGGLAKMYCTSKAAGTSSLRDAGYHGFSGTFLAELSAMSLLSITSTRVGSRTSSTLALHHGKVVVRQGAEAASLWNADMVRSHGTSVTVRDLFGNMAVRVKQRALAIASSSADERVWHELKYGIVSLLMAWPRPCALRLQDENSEVRSINLAGNQSTTTNLLTARGLNRLNGRPAKLDLRDMLPVLFQSGLAPQESRHRWIPLSALTPRLTLKGVICQDPVPSKQCQFISVGIRPLGITSGHNELFDAVNKVFSRSDFGTVDELSEKFYDAEMLSISQRSTGDRASARRSHSRKGIDKHPMFCLQVAFKETDQQSAFNMAGISDATLQSVVDVLEASVSAWLENNHFQPKKRRRRQIEDVKSSANVSSTRLRPSSASSLPGMREVSTRFDTEHDLGRHRASGTSIYRDQDAQIGYSARPFSYDNGRPRSLDRRADLQHLSHIRTGSAGQTSTSYRTPTAERCDDHSRPTSHKNESSANFLLPAVSRSERAPLEAGECTMQVDLIKDQTRDGQSPANTDSLPLALHAPLTNATISSDDFGSHNDEELLAAAERAEEQSHARSSKHTADDGHTTHDGIVEWVDPLSKLVFRINARTGVVLPKVTTSEEAPPGPKHGINLPHRDSAATNTRLSSAGKPLSLAKRKVSSAKQSDQTGDRNDAPDTKWLSGFLKDWNNPVFAKPDEEHIPMLSTSGLGILEHGSGNNLEIAFKNASNAQPPGAKLSKMALKYARVIRQVDRKFILCLLPSGKENAVADRLVLIDQHAASERVTLENLLHDMCLPPDDATQRSDGHVAQSCLRSSSLIHTITQSRSLRYEISAREHELFTRYKTHMACWGIFYNLSRFNPQPIASHIRPPKLDHHVIVTALPTPIAERCMNFPALCIEMIRAEVWALADGKKTQITPQSPPLLADQGQAHSKVLGHAWINLVPAMPKGILDMLHSRSCRSAIMFNDELSLQQSQDLVQQLGECAFPFVCAHGRLSMVPLVDIGISGEGVMGFGGSLRAGKDETDGNARSRESEAIGQWMRSIGRG